MRVLFFLSRFPALSETFVLNQITGLIDLGVDVRIVSRDRPEPGPVHEDFESYRLAEQTVYLQDPDGRFGDSPLGEGLSNIAWGLWNLRLLRFGRKAVNGYLRATLKAWSLHCGDLRPDVIVCHFAPSGDLAVCLRTLGAYDTPIVTVVHGFDVSKKVLNNRPINPRLRSGGDLILPINQRWSDALIKDGFATDKVTIHHVGISVPPDAVTRPTGSPNDPLRIMAVARFVEKKGLEYALRGLALLNAQGSVDFKYTIVGSGPLAPQLKELTAQLGLSQNVVFTGPLSKQDVYAQYATHDIFLLPSVTAADGDQEGIPTVLMEAMAEGLIPVSTFHSGIPELIDHEVSGLLAPERDPESLHAALERLNQNRGAWPEMRKAAREKVDQEFNIRTLNRRLKNLLERVIETGKS